MIKQRPSRDPKFHQIEMFGGAGKSTRAFAAIFSRGWDFRMGVSMLYKWPKGACGQS